MLIVRTSYYPAHLEAHYYLNVYRTKRTLEGGEMRLFSRVAWWAAGSSTRPTTERAVPPGAEEHLLNLRLTESDHCG